MLLFTEYLTLYFQSNSSVTYNFRGSALDKQLKPFTDKGLFLANCSEVHPCLYYVSPTIKWRSVDVKKIASVFSILNYILM